MILSSVLNPMDVTKVRLQTQFLPDEKGETPKSAKYRGFTHAVRTIFKEEGIAGLSRG